MWKSIRQFFQDISDSFKYKEGGYSLRKIIAFLSVSTAGKISIQMMDDSQAAREHGVEMTMVWLTFISLLLGVVTIQKMIELKTGKTFEKEKKTETETIKETETIIQK